MAPNLKEKTSRIAGLMVGARLAGAGVRDLEAVGAWLDGLSAARLDAREVEPRVSASGSGLELLGWDNGSAGLPRAMADWIGAVLDEEERERFFELAARLGADPRRVPRWAGTLGPEGRGYTLAGSASRDAARLDLELAELVIGADGVEALTPVAEAARTEDLVELARGGHQTTVAFPIDEALDVLEAWRSLGGLGASGPLETLLARRLGPASLTATVEGGDLRARGLRVRIADPVALAAALSAASVDETLDARLASIAAAFERDLPSSVELRMTTSGTALWCGF